MIEPNDPIEPVRSDIIRLDAIRLTIVDPQGTVSLVTHSSAAAALTGACASDPATLDDLLVASRAFDRSLRDTVVNGLAVFDEHNLPDDLNHIHRQLDLLDPRHTPVFRVLDAVTREASLRSVRTGVVLFNLLAKRIVQLDNTYEPLTPSGELHYHNGRFLSRKVVVYRLPGSWSIVP